MADKARFTVNLTQELADAVDKYAESMGINRTSAVSVLLSMALANQRAMNDLSELLSIYKASDLGKIDGQGQGQ